MGWRRQWRAHLDGEPPTHLPRWLLIRVLAYRLQADTFGGPDKSIQRRRARDRFDPFAKPPPNGHFARSGRLKSTFLSSSGGTHPFPTAHCEGSRCPRQLAKPFPCSFQILAQIRQAIVERCGGVAEKFMNLQPCNAMAALVDGHSLSGALWSVETNDCRSRNCARADIDSESTNPADCCERQSASVAWRGKTRHRNGHVLFGDCPNCNKAGPTSLH
jgi:hypothetical protein